MEALLEGMEEADQAQQMAAELGLHVDATDVDRARDLLHDVGVQVDLDDSDEDDDEFSDDDELPVRFHHGTKQF